MRGAGEIISPAKVFSIFLSSLFHQNFNDRVAGFLNGVLGASGQVQHKAGGVWLVAYACFGDQLIAGDGRGGDFVPFTYKIHNKTVGLGKGKNLGFERGSGLNA